MLREAVVMLRESAVMLRESTTAVVMLLFSLNCPQNAEDRPTFHSMYSSFHQMNADVEDYSDTVE